MPRDAAALAWMANLALPRAAPASRARRRPRSSRRAARRSRSGARRDVGAGARRRRASCTRRSTSLGSSAGRRRRARAACTSTCASSGAGRSTQVRRAALALAREVERRAPGLATSKWWKEERHGVFLDYNQNAKDRTVAAAYSVRPTPDARVSAPLTWDEVADCDPGRLHARDDAGAVRGRRRSARRDRRSGPARSTRCSSSRRGRSAKGSATRRGRRTTRSSEGRAARASQPSRRSARAEAPADRDRPRAGRRRTRSPASSAGSARHPEAAAHLEPADVLVDAMRGRSSTWTRIRVNLQHVPDDRAASAREAPDPDDDLNDWRPVSPGDVPRRRPARARKAS